MSTESGDEHGGWVIHGKNLVAEVSATGHSQLVSFFAHEGLSVSSESAAHADVVRVHISGEPEKLGDCVKKFLEENPHVPLRVVETDTRVEGDRPGPA